MTPEDLAALHARAFPGPPRPWTASEFADLAASAAVMILTEAPDAFAVLRRAGPELELLTICTAPEARRQGLAARLLTRAEAMARSDGIEEMFLEVAETNHPACALYAKTGYEPRGYRKNYYTAQGRQAVTALVLAKRLI